MMKLENGVLNATQKIPIILDKQQFRPFHVTLQQIDLRSIFHDLIQINEVNSHSVMLPCVHDRILDVKCGFMDNSFSFARSYEAMNNAKV
jgi:hypothetical protein